MMRAFFVFAFGLLALFANVQSANATGEGYIYVCNRTEPAQDIYVAVAEPTLTWDGWRISRLWGWTKIEHGDCPWVYQTGTASATAYVLVEGDNGMSWGSGREAPTGNVLAPRRAYWCVNSEAASSWPDNTRHRMVDPVQCPSGSRMVSAERSTAYPNPYSGPGDTMTLQIR